MIKPFVKKMINEVLNAKDFKSLEMILSLYGKDRDKYTEKFLSLDKKVGIALPTGNRYKSRYAGIIKPVNSYCKSEAADIRFPNYFVQNSCNHLISCVREAYRNYSDHTRVGVPFEELTNKMSDVGLPANTIKLLKKVRIDIYGNRFDTENAIVIYFLCRALARRVFKESKLDPKIIENALF